jgi:hypothetical protein
MRNTLFFALFLLLGQYNLAFSQTTEPTEKKGYKYNNFYEFAASTRYGNQLKGVLRYPPKDKNWVSTLALSWNHLHSFGKKSKINIGYGVRFNSVFYHNQHFTTAPDKLRDLDMDTLTFGFAQMNSLNTTINLQYNFSRKFEAGFNIDAIGFSFGKQNTGTFQSDVYTKNGVLRPISQHSSTPTTLNLLLVGNADIGTLNSEFYAKYWLTEKWAIRGGLVLIFTEYTAHENLTYDNDRFRNKSFQFMLGCTYAPFRK